MWSDYLEGEAATELKDSSCPDTFMIPSSGHSSFVGVQSWFVGGGVLSSIAVDEYLTTIFDQIASLNIANQAYDYAADNCLEPDGCSIYRGVSHITLL